MTLLAYGKGASLARAGFGVWYVCSGRTVRHASTPVPRARGWQCNRCTSFHPGHSPIRRGYGGLRPHPLKGLVP